MTVCLPPLIRPKNQFSNTALHVKISLFEDWWPWCITNMSALPPFHRWILSMNTRSNSSEFIASTISSCLHKIRIPLQFQYDTCILKLVLSCLRAGLDLNHNHLARARAPACFLSMLYPSSQKPLISLLAQDKFHILKQNLEKKRSA